MAPSSTSSLAERGADLGPADVVGFAPVSGSGLGPLRGTGVKDQPATSMISGTWSEAPFPLRSSRSISTPDTVSASAGEAYAKSIRIPSFFGKRSF